MGIIVNNIKPYHIMYNGVEATLYHNGIKIWPEGPSVPNYTIRLKYRDNVTTTFLAGTATQVSVSPNVWDLYYNNTSWHGLLNEQTDLLEVMDANLSEVTDTERTFRYCTALSSVCDLNTTNVTNTKDMFESATSLLNAPTMDMSNVTNMSGMFYECRAMSSVPLYDTNKVTDIRFAFQGCSALPTVPLFDFSKVTLARNAFCRCNSLSSAPDFNLSAARNIALMFDSCSNLKKVPALTLRAVATDPYMDSYYSMEYTFNGCRQVTGGALSLYNYATGIGVSETNGHFCFLGCGYDTTQGRAELNQIPYNWGGELL